ncbi:MAG: hydrogenase iron-sulfur subunit [Dehalococcoidia bacterium]|nr:hydrogenase iron-sulfur subunit [Dehalococcoidia bacterium]
MPDNHNLKIDIFCCTSSCDPQELERSCVKSGAEVKVIPLPCSGKVDILYLTKAFETGADGVAVLTCKEGDCHYLEGNLRAGKRVGAVDMLLEEIGLGKGRMAVIRMGDGGISQVMHEIEDFRQKIEKSPRTYFSGDDLELESKE